MSLADEITAVDLEVRRMAASERDWRLMLEYPDRLGAAWAAQSLKHLAALRAVLARLENLVP